MVAEVATDEPQIAPKAPAQGQMAAMPSRPRWPTQASAALNRACDKPPLRGELAHQQEQRDHRQVVETGPPWHARL
jgi:hypothetical protein